MVYWCALLGLHVFVMRAGILVARKTTSACVDGLFA